MGFPGVYGTVFPVAIVRIAVTLLWMKQVLVSIVNLLLWRGWESPSVRVFSNFSLLWTESEPQEATYGIFCALDAGILAAEIGASIPVVRFGELCQKKLLGSDDEEDELQCSVCLCDFTTEDNVLRVPRCSHVFHKECLDRWTAHHHTTCPLCRSSLTPERQEQQVSLTTTRSSSNGSGLLHFANHVVQLVRRRDAPGRTISTT